METADCFKTFPPLKEHLAIAKGGAGNNMNLNDHLSAIMDHVIIHCPADALNKLEEISYLLKNKDTLGMTDFLKINQVPTYSSPADETHVENS